MAYDKILVRYYSAVLQEEIAETLWAVVVDDTRGLYQIDSIPFYGPPVASNDLVFAEYDETEGMYTYRRTVEPSGNSIVQVVIMDKQSSIDDLRYIFSELECTSEKLSDVFFSLEVPAAVDYRVVRQKLEYLYTMGTIDFAEACVSAQHRG